jgi:hypothetical protein
MLSLLLLMLLLLQLLLLTGGLLARDDLCRLVVLSCVCWAQGGGLSIILLLLLLLLLQLLLLSLEWVLLKLLLLEVLLLQVVLHSRRLQTPGSHDLGDSLTRRRRRRWAGKLQLNLVLVARTTHITHTIVEAVIALFAAHTSL